MKQLENQSVQDYASKKQSAHGQLVECYTLGQCKDHLYYGVLPDVRCEFNKWAVKFDTVSWEELVAKLADAEDNLPEWQSKI